MILQSGSIRFSLSDFLGTHRSRPVQAGLVLRRDFAVFVSLSSRTSPRFPKVVGASIARDLLVCEGQACALLGPVAQLVRARA